MMGLNMQQYISWEGEILVGHAALVDTMKDIIVDVIGAFVICLGGYIMHKRRKEE
jgi:hypothetical protein